MAEYIDREAAIALIRPDAPEDEKAAITIATAKKLIRSTLYRTPAADVAPVVHGRKVEDGDIGCFWLCSLCGECLPYGANYCPNCGARMDGAE